MRQSETLRLQWWISPGREGEGEGEREQAKQESRIRDRGFAVVLMQVHYCLGRWDPLARKKGPCHDLRMPPQSLMVAQLRRRVASGERAGAVEMADSFTTPEDRGAVSRLTTLFAL